MGKSIYCDESGGLGAGAMTFAAVHISSDNAEKLLQRFRDITRHRGELKGSRIDIIERGLFFELLEKYDGTAHVGVIKSGNVSDAIRKAEGSDLKVYNHLLHEVIDNLLPRTGGCGNVVIDEGRYDPQILENTRQDIANMLGNWGKAQLIDSKRSIGVQIADVIANSSYNIVTGSSKAERLSRIMAPMMQSHRITMRHYSL